MFAGSDRSVEQREEAVACSGQLVFLLQIVAPF